MVRFAAGFVCAAGTFGGKWSALAAIGIVLITEKVDKPMRSDAVRRQWTMARAVMIVRR